MWKVNIKLTSRDYKGYNLNKFTWSHNYNKKEKQPLSIGTKIAANYDQRHFGKLTYWWTKLVMVASKINQYILAHTKLLFWRLVK